MSASLSAITHAVAAVAYLGAAGWAALRLRGTALWLTALVALIAHALWATGVASWSRFDATSPALLLGADSVRYFFWSLLLARIPVVAQNQGTRRVLPGACAAALLFALAQHFFRGSLGEPSRTLSVGGLLLAFAGIVVVEQMFRHAPPGATRALRFCAIGLGGQFVFDLVLYSQMALSTGLVTTALAARGVVQVLLLPFVLLGLGQLGAVRAVMFVSREVVFYTTAFLAVGAYLLLMALGGYYVRVFGGSWGSWLRMVFFSGGGIALAVLVLSDSGWKRLRVWIAKNFYRNKYDYRAEWLRFIATLSQNGTDARQLAIRSVAQIIGSPAGALYVRGDDEDVYDAVAYWSDEGETLPVLPAFGGQSELVRRLDEKEWVVDLAELRDRTRAHAPLELPPWLAMPANGWRIVTPLRGPVGLVGFLLLREPRTPYQMTYEDRDLLKTVGRQVASLLIQQTTGARLAESQQFAAFSRLAAFVMHDLKNSVAQLQLIVNNATRHRHNPEFVDDAIDTIANTVGRMTHLIEQLQTRGDSVPARELTLARLAGEAVARAGRRAPEPALHNEFPEAVVRGDPERLAAMLDHVIRNAQEAAGPQGTVLVNVSADADRVLLAIEDDGPGMDPEFVRERLFKPFDSTKGTKGMGIGAYQVREYAREMGGQVEVRSSPGEKTVFRIRLPLCPTRS